MGVIIILFCSFNAPSYSDYTDYSVIFADDFVLPHTHYWTTASIYWNYNQNEYMQEYFDIVARSYVTAEDTLFSLLINIPEGTDSLFVQVPMTYFAEAVILAGGRYTNLQLMVLESGKYHEVWQFYCTKEVAIDSLTVAEMIPEEFWTPGESIQLVFAGEIFAENNNSSYDVYVELDWKLDDVTLYATGGSVIQRDTWASIKASF